MLRRRVRVAHRQTSARPGDWRDALASNGCESQRVVEEKSNHVGRDGPAQFASEPAAGRCNTYDANVTATNVSTNSGIASQVSNRRAGFRSGISIGTAGGELFGGSMSSLDSLEAIAAHVATCTRCPLYSTATKPVPGEGNPDADLMCVGEAPGATEDQTGRPFVGAAGQLLTKILAAIELPREQVFICNVLKHRPPG